MLFSWTFDASIVAFVVALLGWTGLATFAAIIAIASLAACFVSASRPWRLTRHAKPYLLQATALRLQAQDAAQMKRFPLLMTALAVLACGAVVPSPEALSQEEKAPAVHGVIIARRTGRIRRA